MTEDLRYQALYHGINQLDDEDINRLLAVSVDEVLYDGGNYDDVLDRYCPLAHALNIPSELKRLGAWPTDKIVENTIRWIGHSKYGYGFLYNQLKNTPGSFYRDNRPADLRLVCNQIVAERRKAREKTC